MNRRLVGLLAAFCLLSACEEKPVGQLEPIAPPPGTPPAAARPASTPAPAPSPAPAPTPPAEPAAPVDPSQVLLRWKLDAPDAYRLVVSSEGPSRASPSSPPDRKAAPRVHKAVRGKHGPAAAEPSPPPAAGTAAASPLNDTGLGTTFFVLRASEPVSGALPFALVPESPSAEVRQGTMSARGFVLGGLSGPVRDLAVMALELPELPVAPGATWPLATNLVDEDALPTGFRIQKTQQTSQVKLASVTPTADGDQVATLDYDLLESVSGQQGFVRREPRPPSGSDTAKGAHGHPESTPLPVRKPLSGSRRSAAAPAASPVAPPASGPELSAEVRVSGRGEFLVKEGRWRSWELRMTTRTVGLTLPGLPEGERVLRLTRVTPVPAELLQRLTTAK